MRLLILCLILTITYAEDGLGRNGDRVMAAYDKAMASAKADYDEAVAKAMADAVKALGKEQDAVTRKGDLDTALAIRAKIEELESGAMLDSPANNSTASAGPTRRGKLAIDVSRPAVLPCASVPLEVLDASVAIAPKTFSPPRADRMVDGDTGSVAWLSPLTEYQFEWAPVKASAMLIYTRQKGGGEDTAQNCRIVINGVTLEMGDIPSESVVVLPIPGGALQTLSFRFLTAINSPGIREIRLLP